MKINRDDEALLEQLGALAREEDALVRAAEARLGATDASAERAFNAVQASWSRSRPSSLSTRWWKKLVRWYGIPLLLPVAATLLFLLCSLPPQTGSHERAAYELSVLSGGAGLRGPAQSQALRAGSTVRLLLRPAEQTAVAPHVEVSFDDGLTVRYLTAEQERDAGGAVQLLLTLPAQPGRLTIALSDVREWALPVTP
jgi:hypothetical protein